jgi:hypothetical protein
LKSSPCWITPSNISRSGAYLLKNSDLSSTLVGYLECFPLEYWILRIKPDFCDSKHISWENWRVLMHLRIDKG